MAIWLGLFAVAVVPAALTVATYNVENYTIADRMVEGVYRQAYPKPEKEKAALQQVVAGIAPDILAVCEMGKPEYLAEFQRELKQVGQDFPHTVVLEAADPDRHVAVLSKVPFKEVRRHAHVPIMYFGEADVVKRGVLEVIFATQEGDISLFVVHLKSKFTERKDDPESGIRRAAEAEAARDLVLSRYPDPRKAKFIVCGDWNDTRTTRPVRALLKRGETDIGELLSATDSRGDTWTHYFRREDLYSRIDYLMVSPGLKPLVAGGRARIWDGAGTTDASDHRALFTTLQVTPVK
ncbi:MAG TPA: endonuclease/exonuclease/phosphatase family protein [Lacunisphaera sp.]|nr:endonuclease/exonuclease/phosphatase family protein [Lacunisphaera sp.]